MLQICYYQAGHCKRKGCVIDSVLERTRERSSSLNSGVVQTDHINWQ